MGGPTGAPLALLAASLLIGCVRQGPAPAVQPLGPPVAAPGGTPSDALYFVLVDRFADGMPDPPGTVDPDDPQAFHGGDLRGLVQRLDHIRELGFGGIWLSPITAMRTEKIDEWGAFHGYWVTDLGALEPRFGTPDDLAALADGLRARGMRLYLDMVYNHVGYDAPLLSEHPEWFHHNGDITDWDDPVQVVTHDVHGLPDLAQENEAVYQYLLEQSRVWIDRVQPDGFRVDAVRHLPDGFLARLGDDLRAEAGDDFALLGEVFDGNPDTLAARWRSDRLTAVFDFPLHYAMQDVFCGGRSVGRLASVISADRAYGGIRSGPQLAPVVTFLDNHDVARIRSACGDDRGRVQRALAFLLTARGTPCLTYGTEVGLQGAEEPENRAMMRFGEQAPEGEAIRHWLGLRAAWPALTEGTTETEHLDDRVWVSRRVAPGEVVQVAVNQGEAAFALPPVEGARLDVAYGVTGPEGPVPVDREDGAEDGGLVAPGGSVLVARWVRDGEGEAQRAAEGPVERALTVRGMPLGEGDVPVLVGGGERLGSWDPGAARVGVRSGEEVVFTVPAFPGEVLAAKLVVRHPDGGETWEEREDRYLFASGAWAPATWGQ